MGEVTLKINGRNYAVVCDDGEEPHLTRLGALINQRIEDLIALVGQVDEPRLLVMTGLLIADELSEANARVSELEESRRGPSGESALPGAAEAALALDHCASQIESIAARLEET